MTGRPWFVYRRAPGTMSAAPVGVRGWSAPIGFLTVKVVAAMLILPPLIRWSPPVGFAVLMIAIPAAILGFVRLVVLPRGRAVP